MLPQISSDIHFLPSTMVVYHGYNSSKTQPDGRKVTEIILKSSWHKHLKHSKPYTFILQKVKNPSDEFFTHLYFASEIILIFCVIFLYRLSRLFKENLKCLRVPTTDFSRRNMNKQERESKFK